MQQGPYIPVRFDLYSTVRPALRWTLQCLVGFADRTGKCWPSVRKLAAVAGLSKSTVSRHLAKLERDGTLSRQRKAGGVYAYQVDRRFLPAGREVSRTRNRAVPSGQTEEYPIKKTDSALPDDSAKWEARLRSWHRSRFWLPFWDPKPTEPGCFVPPGLMSTGKTANTVTA